MFEGVATGTLTGMQSLSGLLDFQCIISTKIGGTKHHEFASLSHRLEWHEARQIMWSEPTYSWHAWTICSRIWMIV